MFINMVFTYLHYMDGLRYICLYIYFVCTLYVYTSFALSSLQVRVKSRFSKVSVICWVIVIFANPKTGLAWLPRLQSFDD